MLGRKLQGLRFPNFSEIDDDYCDDVEIMIEEEDDLLKAEEIFKKFESFAGAILNRTSKSKIMGIGGYKDRQNWPLPWLKVEKNLKIFGVYICPTYKEILELNWSELLKKFRGKLISWNLRSLDTFQQRVDVLQIFGTSKLWYLCQVLPLPPAFAAKFENIMWRFIWVGKLEKLAMDEIKNPREQGGLNVVCVRSKADALFLRQACRMLAEPNLNSYKHLKYWVGLYLEEALPDMGGGDHAGRTPDYFQHLQRLFMEAHATEIVDSNHLNKIPAKDIYADFTSTFPPPKVIYKYENMPWEEIWGRLNKPVLSSHERDVMFILIHNIIPTRERLFRLNQCRSDQCDKGDGVEDVEHLFTGCVRTQVAWAWCRRKIMHLMPDLPTYPSNFELINLAYDSTMDDEICWLVTQYCCYVYEQKKSRAHNYVIDVDKLRNHLMGLYIKNQRSQNVLAHIPF